MPYPPTPPPQPTPPPYLPEMIKPTEIEPSKYAFFTLTSLALIIRSSLTHVY